MADPSDGRALTVLREMIGRPIRPALGSRRQIESLLASNGHEPRAGGHATSDAWSEVARDAHAVRSDPVDWLGRGGDTSIAQTDEEAVEAMAIRLGLPWVHLSWFSPPAEASDLVPLQLARRHRMVPLGRQGNVLVLAVADPDPISLGEVERETGLQIRCVLATATALDHALSLAAVEKGQAGSDPDARRFCHYLARQGLVDIAGVARIREAHVGGSPLDRAAAEVAGLSPEAIARALAAFLDLPLQAVDYAEESAEVIDPLGVPFVRRRLIDPVDAELAQRLSAELAYQWTALPLARREDGVVVVFADPLDGGARRAVEQALGERIVPAVAPRDALVAALGRVYGQKTLGDLLREAGLVTGAELRRALELHQSSGVRLGRALVTLDVVNSRQLATLLARQHKLPYWGVSGAEIDPDVARLIPEELARLHGILPLALDRELILAVVDPLDRQVWHEVERIVGRPVRPVVTSEDELDRALSEVYGSEYVERSTTELMLRTPEDSAVQVLTGGQKIFGVAWLAVSAVALLLFPTVYLTVLASLSTLFYLVFPGYKFYLVIRALSHRLEVATTPEEIAALDERTLPIYTILVPLYKEAAVVPTLIRSLDAMDYPKSKLDVKLLLEEDDVETVRAMRGFKLPSNFHILVVPDRPPKNKPKACNYGLIHARGEYLVIFDAEDVPEPDQLKKALVAFSKLPSHVQCVQAKLNYFNRSQNMLTRWFTAEYSMWFDLCLPGLDATGAPIPLGGTSNHFRTAELRAVGAWDPYNVTEDADLGLRLFKHGYKTAVIDSTTYEEANSRLGNWIRQRSRWVKGYIITWLVHMRHPVRLWRQLGPYGFLSFQMTIGGTFFGFLINPVYWLLTLAWFLTQAGIVDLLFPGPIYYIGSFGLYLGNFLFTYLNVAGLLRRGYYDMVKYALLSPIYWALMSVAAWKGLIQLIHAPAYWEKTTHGLHQPTQP